jgi:hypothetical protein
VELFNNPPYFIDKVPENLTVKFNNSFEYFLPPYKDEEGSPIFLSLIGAPPVDAFIKLVDPLKISIYANKWTQLGLFKLNLTLTDT